MTTELGKSDEWLQFHYEGQDFEIEVVDALDMVRAIDVRHRDDATYCAECRYAEAFRVDADPRKPVRCPNCDGTVMALNPDLLRDVGEAVKRRFGLSRCSLNAAMEFRSSVLNALESAKKKLETRPESPTGTELTVEAGAV